MKRGRTLRRLLAAVCFCALFCALFAGATQLLRNKDSAGAVRALYEEPRDSLDVVFVGSSHILNGAFPLELWHEYGIVSNNLGQHGQSIPISYYMVQEAIRTQHPGCIVLDVRMPGGMTGLELQQELLRCSCGLPLIFVSAHGNIEMAVRAVQNGACDFIPKPVDEEKLFAAIEKAVAKCEADYDARADRREQETRWNALTVREKEVASCLAQGMPNKVIAAKLGIANRTVQVYRASIYVKLGVRSPAEIANLIHQLG